jgi:hypothetical protein
MSQIEAAIHESDMKLQQHSASVDKQERHIRQHEHEIAVQEQKDSYDDCTVLSDQHKEFNANQMHINEAHARIGRQHREQMASLKRLLGQFVKST